jgi:hypothetical protein
MDCVDELSKSRNLVIAVGSGLARGGLAIEPDVEIPRDEERRSPCGDRNIKINQLRRDETLVRGARFGRGGLDETPREFEPADPEWGEEHEGLPGWTRK